MIYLSFEIIKNEYLFILRLKALKALYYMCPSRPRAIAIHDKFLTNGKSN
jgi:hypothetical protein